MTPQDHLWVIQRNVIQANLNYPEDRAAPMATTDQRSRIRLAIQQVIPGITDEDRYLVTAMLGRYKPELFSKKNKTRILTVGAAIEIISWMYGGPKRRLAKDEPLRPEAIESIKYCYAELRQRNSVSQMEGTSTNLETP
jgi:hypothetical protein